jgi:hypothetical protein
VGVPGLAGSNVTCCPLKSKAVHWAADGHATPLKECWPFSSIAAGLDHDNCASEAAGSQHATPHNATSTTSSRRTATGTTQPRARAIIDPGPPLLRYPTDPGLRLRAPITSTSTRPSQRASADERGILHPGAPQHTPRRRADYPMLLLWKELNDTSHGGDLRTAPAKPASAAAGFLCRRSGGGLSLSRASNRATGLPAAGSLLMQSPKSRRPLERNEVEQRCEFA